MENDLLRGAPGKNKITYPLDALGELYDFQILAAYKPAMMNILNRTREFRRLE